MRNTQKLKKLERLKRQGHFTSKDANKLGVSTSVIAYYIKKRDLERIGHGIYHFKNSSNVQDIRWEDLVEALCKVKGGVICLVSALALYELTEEIPREHWIAVKNTTRHRGDESVIRIVRFRNITLGKTFYNLDGIKLPIFDRERTIVDSFRYLGTEVAIKALKFALSKKGKEKIDLEKMRKYAKALRVKIEPYILAVTT